MNCLAEALELALRGHAIFPCHPDNKRPLVKSDVEGQGGHKLATTDTAVIEQWFARYPKAMIGLPTGRNIGAFVVDIDAGVDEATGEVFSAADILSELERRVGAPLPATVGCTTPRGGLHLYFALPAGDQMPGNRAGVVPRVDIRGVGGYVIVPPSQRSDGKGYSWLSSLLSAAPAIAPVSLLDLIRRPKERSSNLLIKEHVSTRGRLDGSTPYGLAALRSEIAGLRQAMPGMRNESLFHAGISLGQLIASKNLDQRLVEGELASVAEAWPNLRKSLGTIRSGLGRGLKEPREPRPESITVRARDRSATPHSDDLDRKLAEFDATDLGNARRFAERYRNQLLHSDQTSWYQFDGQRWTREGAEAAVTRAAQDTVDALKREAEALADEEPD